ncbi:MAG: carboxypeptidase regulatory-like domain-containing protein, partial [Acidobacteriaceae bacterium]|nr:carboxypeptidase regulatory-like domain-containing protein [Acidobacteriaceae bacterium]
MKRTLISGLVASVGLSAATITGSVFDPSGASLPDAKVSILEPDTSLKQDTTSGATGKFSFEDLPAGQYILRIEKPGYAVLLREFTVQQSSSVERGFSLQLPAAKKDVGANGKQAAQLPD